MMMLMLMMAMMVLLIPIVDADDENADDAVGDEIMKVLRLVVVTDWLWDDESGDDGNEY
jgi:hypothetical protein